MTSDELIALISSLKGTFDDLSDDEKTKAFLQLLRSHYKEKDSATVFHEMTNCVQSSEREVRDCGKRDFSVYII